MNYKWLLFDLDNTLMDFDRSERSALDQALSDFGLESNETLRAIYHRINAACWKAFEDGQLNKEDLRHQRFELFFKAIEKGIDPKRFSRIYLEYLSQTDFLIEGAESLLQEFQQEFNLAIITNGLKEVQRPRLRQSGIDQYFKTLIVSDEIGHAKPQSAFFDYTFQEIAQPAKSDVLVIGDSLNSDMRGGIQYGLDTCWYNAKAKNNATELLPKFEIQNLSELKQVVKG